MMQSLVLITLLMSSVCAQHWEIHEVSSGNELEESSGDALKEGLPGMCWACKWAVSKVKKRVSNGTSQDEIKQMLSMVCNEIGFLKSLCKKFVQKYIDTLIEEISTSDNARTICVNISLCKK